MATVAQQTFAYSVVAPVEHTMTIDWIIQALLAALRPLFEKLLAKDRRWREGPTLEASWWSGGLRPSTQRSYQRAVDNFFAHAAKLNRTLDTAQDVDNAVAEYAFGSPKAMGEVTVAALERVYPLLKGEMRWSRQVLIVKRSTTLPVHHKPMSWRLAQGLAYGLWMCGWPRVGALLLLQWRLGLRPSEALRLQIDDFRWPRLPGQPLVIALGRKRGTKSGREEIAMVQPNDNITMLLAHVLQQTSSPGVILTSIATPQQYNTCLRKAAAAIDVEAIWTGHCPRAGWATEFWLQTQDFVKLRELGRWRSDSSLRVYLDAVCILDLETSPDINRISDWLQRLDAKFPEIWAKLPRDVAWSVRLPPAVPSISKLQLRVGV